MTKRLPSLLLLGCAALLLSATAADAQVVRPHKTLYLEATGGYSLYGGDLEDGQINLDQAEEIENYFSNGSYTFGGELGYQFTESLGFGVRYLFGEYPDLEPGNEDNVDGNSPFQEARNQVLAGFRYYVLPSSRFTPYVRLGAGYVFEEENRTPEEADIAFGDDLGDNFVGYTNGWGPMAGIGFDLLLGKRLSFFVEGVGTFYFPDDAVDGINPGEVQTLSNGEDEADFDFLGHLGGGLRFFFRAPYTNVDATIDCATALEVGQAGTFTAFVNEDASGPLTYMWMWGDGSSSDGLVATHSYNTPGDYTVTFTAEGPANTDTETCVVTVTEPPMEAPVLAQCVARPSTAGIGETVSFSATVTGTPPIRYDYDFGDGADANTLNASHSYSEAGTYTATLTATNEAGSDQCTFTVDVVDTFCDEVTELNTVYFESGMSSLDMEATSRLDENVAVLERCPAICAEILGYTDSRERNPSQLSEARADAVRAYYEQNGIDDGRLDAEGLGVAPDDNYKEDRGAGSRRAESIPVSCMDMDVDDMDMDDDDDGM